VLNTLRAASSTLLHFFLNLGWLLVCYAGLGHVLFGQDIAQFRSFFAALDSLGKFVGFMDYEAIKAVTHQQAGDMTFAEAMSIGMFVSSIVILMYAPLPSLELRCPPTLVTGPPASLSRARYRNQQAHTPLVARPLSHALTSD
jgi:hypothetical protein